MYAVRKALKSDQSYIFKTWLAGLKTISPYKTCRDRFFFPKAQKLLEHILKNDKCKIMLYCDPKDEQFIVSYAIFWKLEHSTILWWIYVRDIHRKKGIAKEMLDSIPDGAKAYVFARNFKDFNIEAKLLKPREFEYYPTLVFDAIEIGVQK